jgi:uncharacterized protein YndB with AHSA1/START domain
MPKKTRSLKNKPVSKSQTLTFKQTINLSPAEAFRMFTHETALRDWFSNSAQADARAGGVLFLRWNSGYQVCASITAYEPGKRLVLLWDGKGEPAPTRVAISFKAKGSGTVVTVSQGGVGSGSKWAATRQEIKDGWASGLENLKSVAESGIDLRIARRPRLGIFIGDFTPEVAAKIGVPVSKGIKIDGTAEGSGARAAGLEKDDVLVRLDGKPAVDFQTLEVAIHGHKAGERVMIEWYRGKQKMKAQLEFGKFPIPELPETAADLAMLARKQYFDINTGLPKLLVGVSETEAGTHSGENWSVKDLIAHFILMDRDFQSWMADMLNDTPAGDDLRMRPNVTQRIAAVVERCTTVQELLNELKRASDETIRMLETLPPTFVARKHLFRRVASWALETTPTHFHEEHSEQIKTAILAAKKK